MSGNIVMITVMGGMRVFWGPLVGAVLFVMLQDYVSSMTTNWMFFVGMRVRAGRAVLSARLAGHAADEGRAHERRPFPSSRSATPPRTSAA